MIKNTTIELCCGSIEDCLIANDLPIDRIELNSALELGGLTVTIASLQLAKQITNKPICTMVRCRTAGFCYSELEYQSMLIDAKNLLENGADGIVFGFLNIDNTIDINRTKTMVDLIKSYHKEAIFHKAFDDTPDKIQACKQLIDLKVDRILTSGGPNYPHIEQGYPILKELITKFNDQITILVGGGVRDYNIKEIIDNTGCTQIHMSSRYMANDNGEYAKVSKDKLIKILNNI